MWNSRKESAMWPTLQRVSCLIQPFKGCSKMLNENGVSDVCLKLAEQRSNLSLKLVCWGEKKKKCLTFDHPCYESGEVPWFSSISTAPLLHRPNWICNMPSVKCNVTRTPCIFHSLPHKLPSRCRDFSENYDPIFLLSSSGTTTTL